MARSGNGCGGTFGGSDDVILRGGTLDDTFLTAVAVAPDGGPVLTDGRKLLKIAPDGRERIIPRPDIPAPAPPPPACTRSAARGAASGCTVGGLRRRRRLVGLLAARRVKKKSGRTQPPILKFCVVVWPSRS